jgi:hypothetical protein
MKINTEKNNEYCKRWRESHREEYREKRRDYMREYYRGKKEYEFIGIASLGCLKI